MPTDHIKNRNMLMQIVLMVITLGFYAIYWFHVTLREMHIANGKDASQILWTILLFVPIADLFSLWHYGSESQEFTKGKYPGFVIFLLWIFFSPAVWIMMQLELNNAAPQA